MTSLRITGVPKSNDTCITNYSDDELMLRECIFKRQSLEFQKESKIKMKQNLITLIEENDSISKCLLKIKKDYELCKLELCRTLFYQKVRADKEKILSGNMIKRYKEKKLSIEDLDKMSPTALELEELIRRNNSLLEQCTKLAVLLELTKRQYDGMISTSIKNFKKKVCEFCDTVLRMNAFND